MMHGTTNIKFNNIRSSSCPLPQKFEAEWTSHAVGISQPGRFTLSRISLATVIFFFHCRHNIFVRLSVAFRSSLHLTIKKKCDGLNVAVV